MKTITLTSGSITLVDDIDYDYLSKHNWWENCNGYAWRQKQVNGKVQSIFMHRLIANTPQNKDTDHINRNKLDNQKSNLRVVTRSENMLNINPTKANKSGYIGVSLHKKTGRWRAYITKNGKQKSLGYFNDKKEAVKARQLCV